MFTLTLMGLVIWVLRVQYLHDLVDGCINGRPRKRSVHGETVGSLI